MTNAIRQVKPTMVTQSNTPDNLTAMIPFSQEAEEAVLGALLLQPRIFPIIARRLIAEDFFLYRHAYIFRAMENQYKEFKTYDYLTISDYLRQVGHLDEIGGMAYLTRLVNQTPTSMHAEVYAEHVSRPAIRRRMLVASDEIRKLAFDESIPLHDVIAQGAKKYAVATMDFAKRQEKFWGDIIDAELEKHQHPEQYVDEGIALEFPFPEIEFKLVEQEITMLYGLTGTGKTAFTLWMILHHLMVGRRVIFISLEMSMEKVLARLTALMTGVSAEQIEQRTYDVKYRTQVIEAMKILKSYHNQLFIVEKAKTAKAINRSVASIAYTIDIDLVVVDHLKIVGSENTRQPEHERLEEVSQELKEQAKEYNCPYLVLHQLKSPPPHRVDKTPYVTDGYGGKWVEHVADNIYAIHRDDHSELGIESYEAGRVDLFQLKNRNGGDNRRKLAGHLRYTGNEQYSKWREINARY